MFSAEGTVRAKALWWAVLTCLRPVSWSRASEESGGEIGELGGWWWRANSSSLYGHSKDFGFYSEGSEQGRTVTDLHFNRVPLVATRGTDC